MRHGLPRQEHERRTHHDRHARENLDVGEAAVVAVLQGAADGVADERGGRDEHEHAAGAQADLADVADGGDEGGQDGDEGAAAEAVEGGEDEAGRGARGGQPQGEADEAAEVAHGHGHVEAAELVGDEARQDAAEDGDGVEHGDQVAGQVGVGADRDGRQRDEVEGQEDAEEDEEGGHDEQHEGRLAQRPQQAHELEPARRVGQARGHRQVGDDQQAQDQEAGDAHGPAVADLRQQPLHQDGEDDAAERGAAGHDAERERAPPQEPRRRRRHGRVEDAAGAQRRADALGQQDLVVLRAQRGHHDAEDVQEGAHQQDVARAVAVVEGADDGTAELVASQHCPLS